MSATVTRTKLIIPRRRSDLLSRSRLISVFDDVLDYPYTLISAPAGYGKTSLMIDLAHQANYPVCWYTTDPLDLDPNRFLSHLVQSIRIQFPTFGSEALSLLENQANPLQNSSQVVRILTNEIYQTISEHFVIFIDDFHNLNSDIDICSFISQFGQEMDDNTHLVMASRTLFDFPDLTLLIGRRQVKGIGFDELAFQTNEIKSYYREILQREITDKETETLLERTEGWITGLVFSVDTDLAHLPGSGKKGRITGADLFQYLAEQVFDKQPPVLQDFLLRSSLLEEFNSDFCNLVLGRSDTENWSTLIFDLQQKNLFVQQVEDEDAWIRYHALFRDFLRARFHDHFPEDEKKIYTRLLDIYLASGSWENAFAAAKQIGNPALMADVIDQANTTLIHQGRMKLLSSWLKILPKEGFESLPWLYLLHGFILTEIGYPQKGQSKINYAIKNQVDASDDFLITAFTWRATSNRILGNYKGALNDSINAIELSQIDPIDSPLIAESYREKGIAYGRLGKNLDSIINLKLSLEEYQRFQKKNNAAQVQIDLGHAYMQVGDYRNAKEEFEKSLSYWARTKNKNKLSILNNNLGYLAILNGKYNIADTFLQKALTYAEESSSVRLQALAIASLGDLSSSIKLLRNSLDKYDESRKIADQIKEGYLLSYISLNRAINYRYLGKNNESIDNLQIAYTFTLQSSSRNELGQWQLEMGFQQLVLHNHLSSRDSFTQAEIIFKSTGKPIELAKTQIGLVLVSHLMASSRTVKQRIKELIATLLSLETNQPLMPELHFQAIPFKAALMNGPNSPVLDSLFDDLNTYSKRLSSWQKEIFPKVQSHQLSAIHLNIIALGQNQVLVNGEKIDSPEWIYQKTVRELFFYLLTLPRGATKEQIGLIFWPDSSPSQLTCQFKNVIYRMRRSLGRNAILYSPETRSYSFNRAWSYSYDVEKFSSLILKAEKESDLHERIKYYEQSIDLYKHSYSPQLSGVWAEPIRQNLAYKFEKALLIIAKYKLDQNQNQECLLYCQKILDIEPCQEKAYQYCMNAHANLSDRNGILRVYSECSENLNLFYKISPSLETKQLKERLIN